MGSPAIVRPAIRTDGVDTGGGEECRARQDRRLRPMHLTLQAGDSRLPGFCGTGEVAAGRRCRLGMCETHAAPRKVDVHSGTNQPVARLGAERHHARQVRNTARCRFRWASDAFELDRRLTPRPSIGGRAQDRIGIQVRRSFVSDDSPGHAISRIRARGSPRTSRNPGLVGRGCRVDPPHEVLGGRAPAEILVGVRVSRLRTHQREPHLRRVTRGAVVAARHMSASRVPPHITPTRAAESRTWLVQRQQGLDEARSDSVAVRGHSDVLQIPAAESRGAIPRLIERHACPSAGTIGWRPAGKRTV